MRTSILAAALILLGLHVTREAEAQVNFGVRAGLNVSNFSGDDLEDSEAKLGFVGGVFADYALTPTLSVQPELLYSQQGANFDDEFGGGSINVDYINIPVLVKYTVPTGNNLVPSVYAGPQLGIKVSESIRVDDVSEDLGLFSGTDFGLALGADIGAQLAGRTQHFGVGLRYTLGLSNAIDSSELLEPGEPDITVRNNVFSVTAYFRF